uniref:Uncharacterized protein n=1 Tax=Setaria italica TaxID=4555 RepID=K3XP12_SETIT
MASFTEIRKIARTLPHRKAPFEERQNLTYGDWRCSRAPTPESCLKGTYTCSHLPTPPVKIDPLQSAYRN